MIFYQKVASYVNYLALETSPIKFFDVDMVKYQTRLQKFIATLLSASKIDKYYIKNLQTYSPKPFTFIAEKSIDDLANTWGVSPDILKQEIEATKNDSIPLITTMTELETRADMWRNIPVKSDNWGIKAIWYIPPTASFTRLYLEPFLILSWDKETDSYHIGKNKVGEVDFMRFILKCDSNQFITTEAVTYLRSCSMLQAFNTARYAATKLTVENLNEVISELKIKGTSQLVKKEKLEKIIETLQKTDSVVPPKVSVVLENNPYLFCKEGLSAYIELLSKSIGIGYGKVCNSKHTPLEERLKLDEINSGITTLDILDLDAPFEACLLSVKTT